MPWLDAMSGGKPSFLVEGDGGENFTVDDASIAANLAKVWERFTYSSLALAERRRQCSDDGSCSRGSSQPKGGRQTTRNHVRQRI